LSQSDLTKRYRIKDGSRFKLADFDPDDQHGLDKDSAKALLTQSAERLGALQERLYAEHQWAVLIVLQGLDAAGKDGVIEHVMSGGQPSSCRDAAISASLTALITKRCW
jgi:polyphosphate kinase 2 (PPK2 family)